MKTTFTFVGLSSNDGILRKVNRPPLDRANLEGSDVLGKPIWETYWWSYSPDVQEEVRRALGRAAEGETVHYEGALRVGDESYIPVGMIFSPLVDAKGRVVRVVSSGLDISERASQEEMARQHQHELEKSAARQVKKLEETNEKLRLEIEGREQAEGELVNAHAAVERALLARKRFMSNMSHELRTPLNAILGFADLLGEEYFGPLNEKQSEYVKFIEESGHQLLLLTNDLLDIARIDSGAMEVNPETFFISDLIEGSVAPMKQKFLDRKIAIETLTDPALGTAYLDFHKCHQIMANLLSNALRYTHEGGRVEVRADFRDDGKLQISVSDTGGGIEPMEQKRIFQEFYQIERGQSTPPGGTGIGLALTRRLVTVLGGEIGVASDPGKGSTFWFTLPIVPSPEGAGEEVAEPQDPSSKRGRILVAEDNELNLALLLDILGAHGYEVSVARNGQEALDLALATRPDLILMDIRMPVMNGIEATERIRADKNLADVPIIALSASSDLELVERCKAAGCTHHHAKPIRARELIALIGEHLGE